MREPRLFGLMVTRNEADRYLQACLEWHAPLFDGLLVYDDQSDDATFHVVRHVGATYVRRPVGVPSFMEHEGHFRQDSLDQLVARFGLAAGDWVAVIDTDEFLVGPDDLRGALRGAIRRAEASGAKALTINRPELWSLSPPAERVDGYWGGIVCTRVFRWEPGGRIRDAAMGCGAEPDYIATSRLYREGTIRLVHVGYVDPRDRQDKYERYTSLTDHGHNHGHIESILGRPRLRDWTDPLPPIWRGLRSGSAHVS